MKNQLIPGMHSYLSKLGKSALMIIFMVCFINSFSSGICKNTKKASLPVKSFFVFSQEPALESGLELELGLKEEKNFTIKKIWKKLNILEVECNENYWSLKDIQACFKKISKKIKIIDSKINFSIRTSDRPVQTYSFNEIKSRPRFYNWAIDTCETGYVNSRMGIKGRNVRVGIIDTGIQADHPDLRDKIIAFKDFFDPSNTEPVDMHGHGTFQAGIIAGGKRTGLAPEAALIVARVFNPPYETPLSSILDSLEWMLDPDGDPATDDAPHIICNAWGNDLKKDDFFLYVVQKIEAAGILPVFEVSPNGSMGCGCPANYTEAFTAGALTRSLNISYFSSYGISPYSYQRKPELSAPGEWIFSCWNNSGYTVKDGPSCAASITSGVAALVVQAAPDLKSKELKKALLAGVMPFPNPDWVGKRGGAGVLNARQSVLAAARCAQVKFIVSNDTALKKSASDKNMPQNQHDGGLWNIKSKINLYVPSLDLKTDPYSTLFLPAGQRKLIFKKAGFKDIIHTVNLSKNEIIEIPLKFQPMDVSVLKINWQIPPSYEPEWFEVSIKHKNDPFVRGSWFFEGIPGSIEIPVDKWDITFDAAGFYPVCINDFKAENTKDQINIPMARLEALLFVDDDKARNSDKPLVNALNELKIPFYNFNYDENGHLMSSRFLNQFSCVLWCLGNEMSNVFSNSDIQALTDFSFSGGGIIASGQDLVYKLSSNREFKSLFMADLKNDNAIIKEIQSAKGLEIFENLNFTIDSIEPDLVQWSPDAIFISSGPGSQKGFEILKYQSGSFNPGSAAVAVDHIAGRRILFAFGLEAVTDPQTLRVLLTKSIDWVCFTKKMLLKRYLSIAAKNADTNSVTLNNTLKSMLKRIFLDISLTEARIIAKSIKGLTAQKSITPGLAIYLTPVISKLIELEKVRPDKYKGITEILHTEMPHNE